MFFACYLLKSIKSDVLQLSAKLDSSPISPHQQCARSEKKNHAIEGPPIFALKSAPPGLKQCNFCKCCTTGATLKYGMTLPIFLHRGGTLRNPYKTHPPSSLKFVHNDDHHRREGWIHPFLMPHAHINHPNFNVQHPHITRTRQGEKNSSLCLFSSWLVPGAIRPRPRLAGHLTCLSCGTPLTRMSPKHRGCVGLMCCLKMVSKLNNCWLLHVSLMIQPVSHARSSLLRSISQQKIVCQPKNTPLLLIN